MVKVTKKNIPHTSLRLNLLVICEVVLLLFVSLAVLLYFSRQVLEKEALHDAMMTAEGTKQHNSNLRMSVEQTTQSIYQDLQGHLHQSERMKLYCQKLVESNPHIVGCAIAFKPHFYPGRDHFVVAERKDTTAYDNQAWYANSITARRPNWEVYWVDSLTFCQPILLNKKCVGVMAVDLNGNELLPDEGVAEIGDDIMGSYYHLIYLVLVITVVGVVLFFVLCRILIHRQMSPIRQLTDSAQQIAQGRYDTPIPDSHREDEIGELEKHFRKMQLSLASKSGELERLTDRLTKRNEDLRKAYGKAQGSDRMKTTLLHYMTTQMIVPSDLIEKSVTKLSNNYHDIRPREADYEVSVIKDQSGVIINLLDRMVEALNIEVEESEKELKAGKEANDD